MRVLAKVSVFLALTLLLVVGPASATLVAEGDPVEVGSWVQRFEESGVGPFDHIQFMMVTAPEDTFLNPAVNNFSQPGWVQVYYAPSMAAAHGGIVTSMQFDVRFLDAKGDPLEFVFQAWYGNTLQETATANWTGNAWVISGGVHQGVVPPAAPVPEPMTMAMLGCLGAGMLGARKLKGKKQAS